VGEGQAGKRYALVGKDTARRLQEDLAQTDFLPIGRHGEDALRRGYGLSANLFDPLKPRGPGGAWRIGDYSLVGDRVHQSEAVHDELSIGSEIQVVLRGVIPGSHEATRLNVPEASFAPVSSQEQSAVRREGHSERAAVCTHNHLHLNASLFVPHTAILARYG